MEDTNNKYQIVVVFDPKIEAKVRDEALERIGKEVGSEGLEVKEKTDWGIKELAYEINGLKKADFWILDVESEDVLNLSELNLVLNRNSNIIRYLILKK